MAAQGSVPAAPLEPVVKGEQPLTVSASAAGGPAAVACKFEAKSDAGVKMDRSVSVEELPDWGLYDYDGDDEIFGDIAGAPLLALTASGAPMTSLHSLKPDRDVDIVILDSDDEDDAFLFPTVKPEHRLEDTAARFAATAGLAVKPEFKFKP